MDPPQAMTLRAGIPGPDQASTSLTTPMSTQATMGAPSNTSLIQDADGFTIRGGQFTSAAGDVTVHNYYPHPEREITSISPMNLIDGTFSESEIYCTQLLHQKRGFPLYVPGVQQTLPEEYRKRGVTIGDVGRITPEGSFDFFFNIYLPADHPIHNRNVPEDFFPLPLYDTLDLYDQSYLAGHHVSTPSVQRLDPDQDILPDSDFVFRCHSPQGAVLALPHDSHLQKLRNLDTVRTYAATHAESWFRYVNGPRGRGLDGSLYLVTGSEKTSAWGMASFHSVPETFQLTFMLSSGASGASGYRWRGNPAQRKYHDPSPMHEPFWNQTTFIHGLSISLGTGVWARMFETVQIREIANTESRLGGGGSTSSSSSHGSSLSSRILGFFGGGGNDEQSRRHVVLSDFPAISQVMHPGELINNYILSKAPQAIVVMSHDDDWCDIFGEGHSAQTMSGLLQRIGDEYVIVEKGGATFLQAMSTSSRNESHELSSPSGSRSRATSSIAHTSPPAVDHGVAFNPLHHYTAHEIWNMHREGEGSLATLRDQSRSLEDQVSVLIISDNNNDVHAPDAPSMTISVPESDTANNDLRSLRESPASINTAPVFTMPTFAPPVSAVNPSPQGNDHGNVSSDVGFDGPGFDLDWSAMQSGITDLNMSKVAIRSSSGPTFDPVTSSAAVRGWGGEEYERQRKYWTFREDLTSGTGGGAARGAPPPSGKSLMRGAALNPLRSIKSGKAGVGKGFERGDLMKGGGGGIGSGSGRREPIVPWCGMSLNAEEIWNSPLVGSFKVRRVELRSQKPQQRVTIEPFRGPHTIGPKPPHDGLYTNIHKQSKVLAFSIHRHYKPTMAPSPGVGATWSLSVVERRPSTDKETVSGNEDRESVSTVSGRTSYPSTTAKRWPTAMILLAPRHLQEAYTSTNTTKGLRSHGLLDEGPDREGANDRDTRSTGRFAKERQSGGKDKKNGRKEKEKVTSSKQQMSSTSSPTSTHKNEIIAPPPPPPSVPSTLNHPLPTGAPFDVHDPNFTGPTLGAPSVSPSRRRRRDSLDDDPDLDSGSERVPSRTTHNEAFSTMDASSIDQMVLAQDARYGEGSSGVLSRVLRRAPAHLTGPVAPPEVYIPPWVTLQSRVKQEQRRRRHDVLSNSFEDVGLLPPKKSTGGTRAKKAPVGGVDIFAQVPSDVLFMLLPLWPGSTDPVSERNAPKQPPEIPTEQRQYLLVSYKPADERPPPHSKHGQSKKQSSQNSATRGADKGTDKGCDILLTSYHISASLVSHADLQGSGVRLPDEGLPVLGSWHEAWLTKPQVATRDFGLLVIGTCASRDAGIEFDPESLVKLGLCIPVPPATPYEPGLRDKPYAELTPIGKAVLEMAWIGGIAVTSFGPAGSS